MKCLPCLLVLMVLSLAGSCGAAETLERIQHNDPNLVVDLGVGLWAWPLPVDYDGDGDPDLLVSCPDKPYNGVYLFENPGGDKFPVFKPARRLGPATTNLQISYADNQPRFLEQGTEFVDFLKVGQSQPRKLNVPEPVSYTHLTLPTICSV